MHTWSRLQLILLLVFPITAAARPTFVSFRSTALSDPTIPIPIFVWASPILGEPKNQGPIKMVIDEAKTLGYLTFPSQLFLQVRNLSFVFRFQLGPMLAFVFFFRQFRCQLGIAIFQKFLLFHQLGYEKRTRRKYWYQAGNKAKEPPPPLNPSAFTLMTTSGWGQTNLSPLTLPWVSSVTANISSSFFSFWSTWILSSCSFCRAFSSSSNLKRKTLQVQRAKVELQISHLQCSLHEMLFRRSSGNTSWYA